MQRQIKPAADIHREMSAAFLCWARLSICATCGAEKPLPLTSADPDYAKVKVAEKSHFAEREKAEIELFAWQIRILDLSGNDNFGLLESGPLASTEPQ